MRIIIFFDLPVTTSAEIRAYNKFRKYLLKEGFIMLQQSVYTKLAINASSSELVKKRLRKNIPENGIVQMLTITEKQFANIENLIGNSKSNVVDSTERLIII